MEVVEEDLGADLVALVVGVDGVVRVGRSNHVVVEVELDSVGFFL